MPRMLGPKVTECPKMSADTLGRRTFGTADIMGRFYRPIMSADTFGHSVTLGPDIRTLPALCTRLFHDDVEF